MVEIGPAEFMTVGQASNEKMKKRTSTTIDRQETQQQRLKLMVTVAWLTSNYKVYKIHQVYIIS